MAAPEESSSQPLRAPLEAALSVELYQLERLIVRVWLLFGAMGVAGGLVVAATLSRTLGLTCVAASLPFLAWFWLAGRRLAQGPLSPRMKLLSTVVESLIPWVFSVALVLSQSADYALASWVPPMLFCALIVSYCARFRPVAALVTGATSALAYQVVYWAIVRERLSDWAATQLIYQPPMQLSRSVSMLLAGALGMLIANSQRRAFGRAEIAVREQDLFGKYRLVRHVASGAMGKVYEAVYCPEGGFERRVAIKLVHPHLAEQRRIVDAFRREAELCARLAHPNVIQVMDFGRVGQSYFLAMEYVDGMTLAELGGRARATARVLPAGVVAHVAFEILAGLVHAHEGARGADGAPLRVVHRDLCPQNVLISTNGEVKISDFGVARALKDVEVGQTRTVAGHVAYMAPEQARDGRVDPRSDLFPVGVIVWELLTGARLFRRDNEASTLMALVSGPVPAVAGRDPDVDATWDAFLVRALARDPERRFASAADMSAELMRLPGARDDTARERLAQLVGELLREPLPEAAAADDISTQSVTPGDRRPSLTP